MLRREGWPVGKKRVYRLYRLEGLQLHMKVKRRKRISLQRGRVVLATGPNQNWSMDFVHDQMSGGRAFRILTVIRAVESRECDSRGQLSPNRSMRRTGFGPGRLDARLTKDNHRGQRY